MGQDPNQANQVMFTRTPPQTLRATIARSITLGLAIWVACAAPMLTLWYATPIMYAIQQNR